MSVLQIKGITAMTLYYQDSKLLTARELRADPDALLVGYWAVHTKIKGRVVKFLICYSDTANNYTLAISNPLEIIGYGRSLEEIARLYNNHVARAHLSKSLLSIAEVAMVTAG